jgi:hypothetical protein
MHMISLIAAGSPPPAGASPHVRSGGAQILPVLVMAQGYSRFLDPGAPSVPG